jgi:hypothetical protein
MATAVCVHTTLESETIRIPELSAFVGRTVQIIVMEEEPAAAGSPRGLDGAAGLSPVSGRALCGAHGRLEAPEDCDDAEGDWLIGD